MDKDPKLIVHTTEPFNAEPPVEELRENFITPQPLYYVRNHGEVPVIDENTFRLTVNGLVNKVLSLSMQELKNNFSKRTVMATLQCAGNRRNQLIEFAEVPGEVPWQEGAISNATWTGAPLKEILELAGVNTECLFVEFMGADDVFRHGENVGFGASIPIDKAITEDVLLAYEMNDLPLEPTHGFPLRVVVPGYIGARSVKWVTHITLLDHPSKNYFQDHAYRLFPPQAKPDTVVWDTGLQLSELAVNCAITFPKTNTIIEAGKITVKGYAMSGGGRIITRVDISTDGGETWITAKITEGNHKWAWVFWELELELTKGKHEIITRAFDSAANTQPEEAKHVWNFKGYMNNAWHRVYVEAE